MSKVTDFPPNLADSVPATIILGATNSDVIDLHGCTLVGLSVPAGYSGSGFYFKAAAGDAANVGPLKAEDTPYFVGCTAGDRVSLTPAVFKSWRFIQLVSNTAQIADCAIQLHASPV